MPRHKRDEILRYETPTEETFVSYHEEDSFLPERKSTVVMVPKKSAKKKKPGEGKGKRSLEDMMASQPNALAQSLYALERIGALEDGIVKVLELCSEEARELVLKQRKSLQRYADFIDPEE